jgi:hypothetical protein
MISSLSFAERRLKRGTASISDSRFIFSGILYLYRNSGGKKWEPVPANETIITDFTHVDKKCFSLSWDALPAEEGPPACLFHKLLYNSRRVQLARVRVLCYNGNGEATANGAIVVKEKRFWKLLRRDLRTARLN